jgi:hypothetical protein
LPGLLLGDSDNSVISVSAKPAIAMSLLCESQAGEPTPDSWTLFLRFSVLKVLKSPGWYDLGFPKVLLVKDEEAKAWGVLKIKWPS